jgi:hypothetical protein
VLRLFVAFALSLGAVGNTEAADREIRPWASPRVRPFCGCCGCLGVTYNYHRELRAGYGTAFDPRNYDQTEPKYHFGKVRAYPEYWSDLRGYEFHY